LDGPRHGGCCRKAASILADMKEKNVLSILGDTYGRRMFPAYRERHEVEKCYRHTGRDLKEELASDILGET
jgi:hypothetical protein